MYCSRSLPFSNLIVNDSYPKNNLFIILSITLFLVVSQDCPIKKFGLQPVYYQYFELKITLQVKTNFTPF